MRVRNSLRRALAQAGAAMKLPAPQSRPAERTCCDGLCAQGKPCPAFAPGVIDGPYTRPLRARLTAWWRGGAA